MTTSVYLNSLQSGSVTIATGNSTASTATLATPLGTLAFVIFNGQTTDDSGGSAKNHLASLAITGSVGLGFKIAATRIGTTGNLTVNYTVIDPTSSLVASVQAGTISLASGANTGTATLGTSVDTTRSVAFLTGYQTNSTAAVANWTSNLALTNSTTVTANNGGGVNTVGFVVVQFAPGVLNSLQQLSNTTNNSSTSDTFTCSAVVAANTWLAYQGTSTGGTASTYGTTENYLSFGAGSSPTTVIANHQVGHTGNKTTNYTLLEFVAGVISAATGTISLGSSASATAAVSVDTSVTFANYIGESVGLSSYQGNDGHAALALTNGSTLTATVNATGGTPVVGYQTITFSAGGTLSGTAAGASSGSGTLSGVGALSGTASGTGSDTGTLAGAGSIAGTASGASLDTGVLAGSGALAGTAGGSATDTGALGGTGALTGTAAGSNTTLGTLTSGLTLTGTATGTNTASGTMSGKGALSATGAGGNTATGTLSGAGTVSGLASGVNTDTGTLSGSSSGITGTLLGQSTVGGTLSGAGALSGTASGQSADTANLAGQGALLGTAGGANTTAGTLSSSAAGQISGEADGQNTALGTLSGFSSPGASFASRWNIGSSITARVLGLPFKQYRPIGPTNPLAAQIATLNVWVTGDSKRMGTKSFTRAKPDEVYADLDPTKAQPGDYLVGSVVVNAPQDTFFIASQDVPMPIRLVQCNSVLSFYRPATESTASQGFYLGNTGGTPGEGTQYLSGWPASLIQGTKGSEGASKLPGDERAPWFASMLPALAGAQIKPYDVATDANGLRYIVSSVELTKLGWRLTLNYAGT